MIRSFTRGFVGGGTTIATIGTQVNFDQLMTGPDTEDPFTQMQAIFASGTLENRHVVFGATGRRYIFTTRPTVLMGDTMYLRTPQVCSLEWTPGCLWDFSGLDNPTTIAQFLGRYGTLGALKYVTGDLVKGTRTIVVTSGAASGLVFGDRLLLRATTGLATTLGAFASEDGAAPVSITASISGTTMTVTAGSGIIVGAEITGGAAATYVVSFGTGTGGTGTYQISPSQTVASTTLLMYNGYSRARGEDVIVKSVSGDTISLLGALRDNYPSTTTPVLQTYDNEPEVTLINPQILGMGSAISSSFDRFGTFKLGRNFCIEGGKIQNFPHAVSITSVMGGHTRDLAIEGGQEVSAAGGLGWNDCVSDYTVSGCTVTGGSQPFCVSASGQAWGVTRDLRLINCVSNGSVNGFTTHNIHESLRFTNCEANGTTGVAFDFRVRDITALNCTVRNAGSHAAIIRPDCNDLIIDGMRVEGALSGIVLQVAPTEWDYPPFNMTVRNSRFERIGNNSGGLYFKFDNEVVGAPGTFPVLGQLVLENNYIESLFANRNPITVGGRWTGPVIRNNRIVATGMTPTVPWLAMSAPTGGSGTDGPSNPVIEHNTVDVVYPEASITGTTGVLIYDQVTRPAVTSNVVKALTGNFSLVYANNGQTFTNEAAVRSYTVILPSYVAPSLQVYSFYVLANEVLNIIGNILIGGVWQTNIASDVVGAWCRVTRAGSGRWNAEVSDVADWTVAGADMATVYEDNVVGAGGTLSGGRKTIITTFIDAEIASGAWNLTDDYLPMWGENVTQSLLSLKQGRTMTPVLAPTFTADRDYTFNGTTQYMASGFIPDTHGVAMSGTDQRLAVYERVNINTNTTAIGVISGAIPNDRNMYLRPRLNSAVLSQMLNDASIQFIIAADCRGFTAVSRAAGGTTIRGFKNGVALTDVTGATIVANTLPSHSLAIGAINSSGTISQWRGASIGMAVVGAPLSDAQETDQYNNVQAWATSIGANV